MPALVRLRFATDRSKEARADAGAGSGDLEAAPITDETNAAKLWSLRQCVLIAPG
jgi:hypothetical protein